MPPVRSGVAACSADVVDALRREHEIDVFVDEPVARIAPGTRSAHDFVWLNQRSPYDLPIYQLGNSSHHDYLWPYLFRFPGLTVLHDAHLHHARAASLLRSNRAADYRAEFRWNQPAADPDLSELAIAGFDTQLYYWWPMTRLVAQASRLIAVHSPLLRRSLASEVPEARVEHVRLGHGPTLSADAAREARSRVRRRHAVPDDAVFFGCFGALTPDKRIPQILAAFEATLPYAPSARLVLAGASVDQYDVAADVADRGLAERLIVTGYSPSDDELTAYIAACDVALNLRWPTAREISGPWLRCLAAARATIIMDLAHLVDVPSVDPRTWAINSAVRDSGFGGRDSGFAVGDHKTPNDELPSNRATERPTHTAHPESRTQSLRDRTPNPEPRTPNPVCVAIDIVDEDHSLTLAMRRLAMDAELRESLGAAAQAYWQHEHTVDGMVHDYRRLIPIAAQVKPPRPALPEHLVHDCRQTLDGVMRQFGLSSPFHPTAQSPRGGGPGVR
jgi:glycosyltransferase involved in cell wall biosynthesis